MKRMAVTVICLAVLACVALAAPAGVGGIKNAHAGYALGGRP